jgi:SAM-dependent methyltransferase
VYKYPVIDEHQSDRILQYANLVLFAQEGDGGRGGVQFCGAKFHIVKDFFKPNDKILIIGCGNGEEVKEAIDLGFDAVGLTLNIDNLDYAKSEYGIDLIRADMHSVPLDTGTFDGVASFETFEHSYSPLFYLLECNRLLKENGRTIVFYPSLGVGTIEKIAYIHHTICCNIPQLESLFYQSNFKEIVIGNVVNGDKIIRDNTSTIIGTGIKKMFDESITGVREVLYAR